MCPVESAGLLAGDEGGPRDTEASPPERRERDDMVRSLSLSAMSVIASVARCAAERRGLDDILAMVMCALADVVAGAGIYLGDAMGEREEWNGLGEIAKV